MTKPIECHFGAKTVNRMSAEYWSFFSLKRVTSLKKIKIRILRKGNNLLPLMFKRIFKNLMKILKS